MKFTGEFTVAAPRAVVYERLNDAPFFASCIEGVENLQQVDDTNYTATLKTTIGFIKFQFAITVQFVEKVAPEKIVARAEGVPLGAVGRLTSTAAATLREDDGQTIVAYEMDVALAGKLGSIGQPVLKAKAKDMERAFVRNINAAFGVGSGESERAARPLTNRIGLAFAPIRRLFSTADDVATAKPQSAAQAPGSAAQSEEKHVEAGRKPSDSATGQDGRQGILSGVELAHPRSLDEAIAMLDTDDPTVRPFSGGTALMLMMKSGVFKPSVLVDLSGAELEYTQVQADSDGRLTIGALATLSSVEWSPDVARFAPVIVRAMKRLANVRVRNVARIGGNLAHGDPHMDLPPVLAALGGEVVLLGPQGERRIAVEDLFSGYYQTVLSRGELIARAILPSQRGWASDYIKCTTRSADDWPAIGVAASLRIEDGRVAQARMMVSSATEKMTRLTSAEATLIGRAPGDAVFAAAAEAAAAEAVTIDDARGSAAYKSELLRVHARRVLANAISNGAIQ